MGFVITSISEKQFSVHTKGQTEIGLSNQEAISYQGGLVYYRLHSVKDNTILCSATKSPDSADNITLPAGTGRFLLGKFFKS